MLLTRRDAIRLIGSAAVLAHLPACETGDVILSSDERQMLNALADVVIPPDDQPGGSALGVVAYVERLITAFDYQVPRIYAGGPFSDRAGATSNDFTTWIELDRVSVANWLAATSQIKHDLRSGLAAARAMNVKDPVALYNALDDDFRGLIFELVTEAAFAAPEYGGNPNLAGWQMIHFEGDSQPRGYSTWNGTGYDERPDAPMSGPNPSDPEPISNDIHLLLVQVTQFLGGRVKP